MYDARNVKYMKYLEGGKKTDVEEPVKCELVDLNQISKGEF